MDRRAISDAAEAVRLVVWDLDGTFWHGTLTEGGITWRDEAEHAVRTLATRGIVSAICSKNEPGAIADVLARHGLAEWFVFNSLSWDAKGPRLAALIHAVQLRPESVLFIDDNPANLAEALHFVPACRWRMTRSSPACLPIRVARASRIPGSSG